MPSSLIRAITGAVNGYFGFAPGFPAANTAIAGTGILLTHALGNRCSLCNGVHDARRRIEIGKFV